SHHLASRSAWTTQPPRARRTIASAIRTRTSLWLIGLRRMRRAYGAAVMRCRVVVPVLSLVWAIASPSEKSQPVGCAEEASLASAGVVVNAVLAKLAGPPGLAHRFRLGASAVLK